MQYFIKKINSILFLISILFFSTQAFGKNTEVEYSKDNISNYFSGIVSINRDYNNRAFQYLNKTQSLKNRHSNFNVQFIHTLVLLKKFDQAFSFSSSIWHEDEIFLEVELLLGLESFIKKDYSKAEKHFKRLNKISSYDFIFKDFLGNFLLSWVKAVESNLRASYKFHDKIPEGYKNLKQIQNSFLQCYFNTSKAQESFEILVNDEEFGYPRYNFFLANHLLFKNKKDEAKKIIMQGKEIYNSNLLIKQSEIFFLNDNEKEIKSLFNCQNPKDSIAEIFYVIANLYSTEEEYKLSNFYLKISLFLNSKFTPNKTLLAENLFYQKKYELSKKSYESIRSIGEVYSWYVSKNISTILSITLDKKSSVNYLEKKFKSLSNHNFEHYYDLANFYKDNEYYKKSIKYYSLAKKNINGDHFLVPKILDRRGTSRERIGEWEEAEKDLKESLRILPDQPYVLNYLAYSWIEKKINFDKALEMLKKAVKLKENDGYITDSLGWAYFANKNYVDAEKFLRQAVELMPQEPVINDHYADTLWMLNKNIQARYFWKYVLSLDTTEKKLKKIISDKLIFGINNKL